jgi:hypothetical protein
MRLTKLHRSIFTLATIGLSASFTATADEHLYWHEEGGGGYSCGPFCTTVVASHIVIDGWKSDVGDAANSPARFPTGGSSGTKSTDSEDGKISGRSGYKGCTVPRNQSGVRSFLAGKKSWKIYVDDSVSDELTNGFVKSVLDFNADQEARGSNFRIEPTSWRILADTIISTPTWYRTLEDNLTFEMSTTSTRSGNISSSFLTMTNEHLSDDDASSIAARALGSASGLAIQPSEDVNYPSVMQSGSRLTAMDPCTLAAMNANIHSGQSK